MLRRSGHDRNPSEAICAGSELATGCPVGHNLGRTEKPCQASSAGCWGRHT
ncbi:putative protein without homology [Propionibacterium freudenreichii subsp. shermanii]|nr:putative protein without homology [Propionibacterium freudenreichii subsp. shermanii]